ncbi:MAG: NUDIX domain-containing protein [Candidatus Izemoplasmatales bacterium]|jgi:8-oxo-dGTP pyrophosphatase MutT (NUDIX family)|nr:NUDIX domain-containing protein [Candidatus Izemoplasmatales bacterium]
MKHLTTIYRQKDILLNGTILFRKAYRSIVFKENLVLLIKSKKYGEFKFPGGGKELNEVAFDVVKRETLEETGYLIKTKIIPFGWTLEYAKDFEGIFDVFMQESRYYLCQVYPVPRPIQLSSYEIEYGYTPYWVSLEDAIKNNETILSNDLIPWKERDTFVMKLLLEMRN